jgi:hypothetical protein
MSCEA